MLRALAVVFGCSLVVCSSVAAQDQPSEKPAPIVRVDDETRIYVAPIEKVFLAAAQVVAMKWNITHSDKDTFTVSWKTGANMRTNKGFEMSAVCIDLPNGRTKVQVHPQKRPSGQLFSWGEGGRIATTFFQETEKRLREMVILPPETAKK